MLLKTVIHLGDRISIVRGTAVGSTLDEVTLPFPTTGDRIVTGDRQRAVGDSETHWRQDPVT